MRKTIISALMLLLLNSCFVFNLVDGIASGIIDIFVYNEKTEQTYRFTAKAESLNIKIDAQKIYLDEQGRQTIAYKNLPMEYCSLLVLNK